MRPALALTLLLGLAACAEGSAGSAGAAPSVTMGGSVRALYGVSTR